MANELAERIMEVKKQITRENLKGGSLKDLLCPFCGLPRCLRSDYIRCQKCGTNWWVGTDLTRMPHAKPAPTGSLILNQVSGTVVRYQSTDPKSGICEEKSCEVAG